MYLGLNCHDELEERLKTCAYAKSFQLLDMSTEFPAVLGVSARATL